MKTIRKLRLNPAWMLLAACGWATLLLTPASASGQIVDVCSSGSVSYAEETVCVYGSFSSPAQITATASASLTECCYISQIGVDLQLTNNGTLVADTGEPGSTYESTSVVPNGSGPYTATGWIDACYGSSGNCYWEDHTWSLSATTWNPSILYPAYQVTSIIYSAPGNKSSDGYVTSTTDGMTTSVGNSFTAGSTITFTSGGNFLGLGGTLSVNFGDSITSGTSTANSETFTNGTGVSLSNQSTNLNAINHAQDLFLIWLNPAISVVQTGQTTANYSAGTQLTSSGTPEEVDQVEVTAETMEANASGVTTVAPEILDPQNDSSGHPTLPGLANICANVNLAEYQAGQCTFSDQCGCTPNDFKPILGNDPVLAYSTTTNPMNADVSGASVCAENPIPAGSDCRYIPVPDAPGSTQQENELLSGPQCTGCDIPVNSFNQSDANTTTQTLTNTNTQTTGYSWEVDLLSQTGGPKLKSATQFTWNETESSGAINGSANTQSVTFSSSTVYCYEEIPIFEDTIFHTFVFVQPSNNNSCQ